VERCCNARVFESRLHFSTHPCPHPNPLQPDANQHDTGQHGSAAAGPHKTAGRSQLTLAGVFV